MIPLRDTIPSRSFPFITILLILINGAIFLLEISLGKGLVEFVEMFGLIPERYFKLASGEGHNIVQRYLPFLTSIFLHGGWFHVLWNLWFLWIFGDNVEDHFGHFKFLLFYIICGLLAGLAHVYVNPGSIIPTIGASGAIAGVMGAYIVLYPRSKVLTIIPIFFIFPIIHIPAFVFLGIWFISQFISGAASLGIDQSFSGVAWWAHIGGFLAGAVVIIFLFPRKKEQK
ncbi:MAG TPA: rhomboid family intramembrane serine protease [bacterium]|nr:rhomboid family intramembrane serine protease [bacterium]